MKPTQHILDSNFAGEHENNPYNNLAGSGRRFANYVIDAIMFYAIAFIFGIILGISGSQESAGLVWLVYPMYFFYYVILEAAFSKTIGKFITKTKVVKEDGSKPGFVTIMGRTLCRIIPFEAFSFLGNSTGWHDRFSKTLVINDNG